MNKFYCESYFKNIFCKKILIIFLAKIYIYIFFERIFLAKILIIFNCQTRPQVQLKKYIYKNEKGKSRRGWFVAEDQPHKSLRAEIQHNAEREREHSLMASADQLGKSLPPYSDFRIH